jgi:signal transduction histidine kinase
LTLINDILDLSKVEAGKVDLKPTDFNLPLLLEGCCATVGPTLGKPTVELVCKMDEGVGEIYGDEDRLRQVMTNLLSNALKFTDEGLVTVTARRQNTGDRIQEGVKGDSQKQMLEIAVSDTGIGIPEDMLGLVFEEFRQVAGGTIVRQKGTGLGLAITKRLIELMGGTIGVKSEVGKGSVFTVEIPLVYEEGKGQSYLAA